MDIQRQLNNAQRHGGITIEGIRPDHVDVSDAELYRQIANTAQRYGEEPHVKPTFFAALREQMSDNSTIFFARVDGQIGAIAVTLHDDMSISFPFIGQDHTLSRQYGLYFLLHFDAIRYAIERRLPLINMGLTQLDLKRRLGYKPNPRSFIVRSPYRPLDRVLQWAMHRLAPRLIAAVGKQKQGEQAPSPGGAASSGE
jgi:predicted N-acyltransferase